ncbi:HAD family hydrolase [Planococcus shenhongbingii]|uniref:HAD family hydrolase n=1 Tax=Planococcus shenhongbingii TaxID=3058398 RepID=A0ABT8N896_9BACL|nr:HAD family hydrolase [Planococcus sp. N017]
MMKAILFDFDGTLANILPVCDMAFQHVFRKYDQRELSSAEVRAMFGPSETGIIYQNLKHRKKEEAIEQYYDQYLEHHADMIEQNRDIHSLLMHLKEKGLKLGIVTGKAKRSLDISLKALGWEHLFDAMITGDDVVNPKPDPEGVLKILPLLGARADEAVFVGDSDADILAGTAANVVTIGVQWLPDHQTLEFAAAPSFLFKTVHDFREAMEGGFK